MSTNIPINNFIKSSKYKDDIERILTKAESGLNSWERTWSNFISAPIREEIIKKIELLNEIECFSNGGYPSAERQRVCFQRVLNKNSSQPTLVPIKGIKIEGNFLFDRAEKIDFQNVLISLGASYEGLGDIWIMGDRGAQAVCTPDTAIKLDQKIGNIRDVRISCEKVEIIELNLPFSRPPKKIKSVEASTRLDAIASAGFGLSRAKIVKIIKEGKLRLNWGEIKQSSQSIMIGDRLQLENKGSIEVINLEPTRRNRWRIELLRQ